VFDGGGDTVANSCLFSEFDMTAEGDFAGQQLTTTIQQQNNK